MAGLLLLVSVPVRREEMPRAWEFLVGLVGTGTGFAFYLRGAISAFLYDMRLAVQARGSSLSSVGAIGNIASSAEVVTLAIMTVIAMLLIARGGLWQRYAVRVFLLGGVVIASGLFFAQTNESGYEKTSRFAELWVIVLLGLLTLAYPKSKERVAIAALAALSLVQ